MATRKPSSRRAKDAASDFVKRVMRGTWEDSRDVSSLTQTKNKLKPISTSPAKVLISRSSACGSTTKIVISPAKVMTGGSQTKLLTSGSPAKVLTTGGQSKLFASRSSVKILTSDNQARLLTGASHIKLLAGDSTVKVLACTTSTDSLSKECTVKVSAKELPNEVWTSKCYASKDCQPCSISHTKTEKSESTEGGHTDEETSLTTNTSSLSSLTDSCNDSSSTQTSVKEEIKLNDLPDLDNCVNAKVVIEDICKKTTGNLSTEPVVVKRPRGRPRKDPTSSGKKKQLKQPNACPAWLLAGKNKPGRKPKSHTADKLQKTKQMNDEIDTTIKTKIKEEPLDGTYVESSKSADVTDLLNNIKNGSDDNWEAGKNENGMPYQNEDHLLQVKEDPEDNLNKNESHHTSDMMQSKDSCDVTSMMAEPGSIPYPSEQGHFLNMFGLIKKSDIKQESLKNKLHREVGGKLRRIIKPRMAPEMVYNKLTLARGCVLEGESEDKPCLTRDNIRQVSRPRPVHTDQLKLKAKAHEARQPTNIKLSSESLDLDESLLHSGKLEEVKTPSCERNVPNCESQDKKEQLESDKLDTEGEKIPNTVNDHSQKPTKKEKTSSRSSSANSSPNKTIARKHSFNKSGSSPVKEEECPGRRRSSRHQGSQRKQWWHLLRAAPDEFEEDKQWDEEQDRLERKRKMLKERRERELLEQLQAKEAEARELSSSQESSSSNSKHQKPATCETGESKKNLKRGIHAANTQKEPECGKDIIENGGELSGEDTAAETKWKEQGAVQSKPNLKRKRKKRKQAENEELAKIPHHSDLVQQIQPLVKNLMEGGGDTESMQLEMELKPEQLENYPGKGSLETADDSKMEEESLALPEVSICEGHQCTIPHMCSTCWINDHMYCLNMKRTARDLPPFGGCLHYSLCSHYPRRDIEKPTYKCSKLMTGGNTGTETPPNKVEEASIKESLEPVTENDLFCNEQMEDSDASAPESPVPQGTEILKVQLKARAVQIAKSLGVPTSQTQTISTEHALEVFSSLSSVSEDNAVCATDDSNITINQHGAEMILYNGQSYLPNHVFDDLDDHAPSLVKPSSSPKQSPTSAKSVKSTQEVESKSKRLQIRLCPPENLDVPLDDISKVGATHKLVRVKVHRVGENKILLKQMKDFGEVGCEEVLIREIELPATSSGKNEEVDVNWLSHILAEEAVKLASASDKDASVGDHNKGKKKLPLGASTTTVTSLGDTEANDVKLFNPEKASDDTQWTLETLNDEDDDDDSEDASDMMPIDMNHDITEQEVDPEIAQLITITPARECTTPDIPIKIGCLRKNDTDSKDSEGMSITTKSIRDQEPDVLDNLKEPSLLLALCWKLQAEKEALKRLITESDNTLSAYHEEHDQKACLLAALQSEKAMLQENIKQKRETANKLAEETGNIDKFCGCLDMSKEELEDTVSACTAIMDELLKREMFSHHSEEETSNTQLKTVAETNISEIPVTEVSTCSEGKPVCLVQDSISIIQAETVSDVAEPKSVQAPAVDNKQQAKAKQNVQNLLQTDSGELIVLNPVSMASSVKAGTSPICAASAKSTQMQKHYAQSQTMPGSKPININIPVLSNIVIKDARHPDVNLTLSLDQKKKAAVADSSPSKQVAKEPDAASGMNVTLPYGILLLPKAGLVQQNTKQLVSSTPAPVTVMAGTSLVTKLVTSSTQSSPMSRVTGTTKSPPGSISLLGTSLLKRKTHKQSSVTKTQPARQASSVTVISSASLSTSASALASQLAPEVGKSHHVLTATSAATSLPQLSPTILHTIGPNDQIVVLSASQLRQLQHVQEPPCKPVQIRIPLSKGLQVIPTKAQPSPDKPTKQQRPILMSKKILDCKRTLMATSSLAQPAQNDDSSDSCAKLPLSQASLQQTLEQPTSLQYSPNPSQTLLPVATVVSEPVAAEPKGEGFTDLVQLAMQDSQISPKALTEMAEVGMGDKCVDSSDESMALTNSLLHPAVACVTNAQLDEMSSGDLHLEMPCSELEASSMANQEQDQLMPAVPSVGCDASNVVVDMMETQPSHDQFTQSQMPVTQYEVPTLCDPQYPGTVDDQYSDIQMVELPATIVQSLTQPMPEIRQEQQLQIAEQTSIGSAQESIHHITDQLSDSVNYELTVQYPTEVGLGFPKETVGGEPVNSCSNHLVCSTTELPAYGMTEMVDTSCETMVSQCSEQFVISSSQEKANNMSHDVGFTECIGDTGLIFHQDTDIPSPSGSASFDNKLNTDESQVIIEMVNSDGSVVYYQAVPLQAPNSDTSHSQLSGHSTGGTSLQNVQDADADFSPANQESSFLQDGGTTVKQVSAHPSNISKPAIILSSGGTVQHIKTVETSSAINTNSSEIVMVGDIQPESQMNPVSFSNEPTCGVPSDSLEVVTISDDPLINYSAEAANKLVIYEVEASENLQ